MKKEQTVISQPVLDVIKQALWKSGKSEANQEIYEELKKQALSALPADILSSLSMPEDLRHMWQKDIFQRIAYNANYLHEQEALPISVPYVILKGTAAAKYYPRPEFRAMGDIDIMPRRKDYQAVCDMLLAAGYMEIVVDSHSESARHREFKKGKIIVEVHAYFASLNNPFQAEYLDNLIIQNINPSHVLPDLINGLVLLEHISQHLEHGLGLRQIIDWMMFVNKCLPETEWPAFRVLAQHCGLEHLAIVTTKMCELYLGLPVRKWCAAADEALCTRLMEYVLSCGNFGNKWDIDSRKSIKIWMFSPRPKAFFSLLQKYGLENWKSAQTNSFLRPFAWLYQIGRYICKGSTRKESVSKLRNEYAEAKQRNALLDALDVKQTSKGLAVYKNGKYVKNGRP